MYASQPTQSALSGGSRSLLDKYKQKADDKQKKGYKEQIASGFKTGMAGSAAVMLANGAYWNLFSGIPLDTSNFNEKMTRTAGQMLAILAIGGGIGAAGSILHEVFTKNSTPEWLNQMEILVKNKDAISDSVVLRAGVPTDKVDEELEKNYKKPEIIGRLLDRNAKFIRKTYLVSSIFSNIENADKGNHYEIYLMPKDENLVTMFLSVNDFFQAERFRDNIDFIAFRPTPGVTKSPYNSKNMPRIIIGFTPQADKEVVAEAMAMIAFMTIQGEYVTKLGLGIQPRYSYCALKKQENNFIYVAYGSADYKDSAKGKEKYETKPKTLLQRFWSGLSDEAMAFPNNETVITEEQINKAYDNQLNKFLNEAEEKQLAEEKKQFFSQHKNDLLDSVLEHVPTEEEQEMLVEEKWLQELRNRQIKKQNEKRLQDQGYKAQQELIKKMRPSHAADL